MKKLVVIIFAMVFISCQQEDPRSLGQQLKDQMKKFEQRRFSGSIMVVCKGEVLLSDGYGYSDKQEKIRNTTKTVFDFGSLTKQFTGAAIVKAETMGLLTVEQKLKDFFPDVPEDKANITLHQLLTHSSGFEDVLGDDYDLTTKDEFVNLAFLSPLQFSPGSEYSYSNVGYSLLGIVVEQVSKQSYELFLRTHLLSPASIEDTGYNLLKGDSFRNRVAVGYRKGDPDSKPTDKPWLGDGPGWHLRANGGILTTAEDMYKWIKALHERKIFDDSVLKKYLAPYVREDTEPSYYSYGWVVGSSQLGSVYWHDGGNEIFSAIACYFPESETVLIIASNDSTVDASDLVDELVSIIKNNTPSK